MRRQAGLWWGWDGLEGVWLGIQGCSSPLAQSFGNEAKSRQEFGSQCESHRFFSVNLKLFLKLHWPNKNMQVAKYIGLGHLVQRGELNKAKNGLMNFYFKRNRATSLWKDIWDGRRKRGDSNGEFGENRGETIGTSHVMMCELLEKRWGEGIIRGLFLYPVR